jgi:16S rRNA (adenine1518-N6/adenine1519-N6)-dimethyltransferase
VVTGSRPPERSSRRLGQNFLADSNLLDTIVREAALDPADVVLEVGGGGGALTERLAPAAACLHVIEFDERLRSELEPLARELSPPPTKMVANLPYSIATPLLILTITELASIGSWVVMVQREIADRLRAEPGSREYGSASVLVQIACKVSLLRAVDPAVFVPRPRVGSALLGLRRIGPSVSEPLARLVRASFAHRRKSMARSLELARPGMLGPAQRALEQIGRPANARAETLAPNDFKRFAEALAEQGAEL